jgi:hypothetical protein
MALELCKLVYPQMFTIIMRIDEHATPHISFVKFHVVFSAQMLKRFICSSIMLGIDVPSLPRKTTVTYIIYLFKLRSLFYAHVFTAASDTRYKTQLSSIVTKTCKILTLIRFREKNDFFIIKY